VIYKKWIIQQLLKIPSNKPLDRVVIQLIKYGGIDCLLSRLGYHLKISPCADHELLSIRSSVVLGQYESSYLRLLRKIVNEGDVLIDVGANEGYISVPLALKVGRKGHIFSIEPHPANVAVLQENIHMNYLRNVTVVPKAASDMHGVLEFSGDRAWGTLIGCHIKDKKTKVNVDFLDNMIPGSFKSLIKLIKIDAEGNEIQVIRGAKNLILSARPTIAFEVNLSLLAYVDISINEIFHFFEKNNYRLFMEKEGMLKTFEWFDERICNLLAIPGERLLSSDVQAFIAS
jgi:FkbM family methyltransferase